jgi:hypothetical protein
MDKVIAFSNRTEIRDKITRLIQYLAKLFAWLLNERDKKLQKKFIDLNSNLKLKKKQRKI